MRDFFLESRQRRTQASHGLVKQILTALVRSGQCRRGPSGVAKVKRSGLPCQLRVALAAKQREIEPAGRRIDLRRGKDRAGTIKAREHPVGIDTGRIVGKRQRAGFRDRAAISVSGRIVALPRESAFRPGPG